MAIGGVISGRSFGSSPASGKLCQLNRDIPRHSGQGMSFHHIFYHQTSYLTSKCSLVHLASNLNWTSVKHASALSNDRDSPFLVSRHSSEKINSINSIQRPRGRLVCAFPSQSKTRSSIQSQKVKTPLAHDKKCLQFKHVKGARASYKSEEYEMTEANLEPLRSTDGAAEIVLSQEDAKKVSPWCLQIPKR